LADVYKAQECLLLDTANEDIFYTKEVTDEINTKNIRIKFLPDSYLKSTSKKKANIFKDQKVAMLAEIDLRQKSPARVNLKLTSFSQDEDRFIDIYLNDKLIKKFYSKRNTNVLIKLEALTMNSGKNILKFVPNDSEINGKLSLADKVEIYTYEFNCDLVIESDFRGRVSLYPKPIENLKLPKSVTFKENNKTLRLAYNAKDSEYKSSVYNISKGKKSMSFLQYQDEGYYVLIAPEHMPSCQRLPLKETLISPVSLEFTTNKYLSKWKFLFFLESSDPYWTARLKGAHHDVNKYETHFMANGYANAWLLEGQQKVGQQLTIMLKYSVQRQFWAGLGMSVSIFIFCMLGLLSGILRRKGEIKG
jgi:hypothetical protein